MKLTQHWSDVVELPSSGHVTRCCILDSLQFRQKAVTDPRTADIWCVVVSVNLLCLSRQLWVVCGGSATFCRRGRAHERVRSSECSVTDWSCARLRQPAARRSAVHASRRPSVIHPQRGTRELSPLALSCFIMGPSFLEGGPIMYRCCPSVCPVPPPRGKTKRPTKTKLGRKDSRDTSTPWTNFKVKGSKVKVTAANCVVGEKSTTTKARSPRSVVKSK